MDCLLGLLEAMVVSASSILAPMEFHHWSPPHPQVGEVMECLLDLSEAVVVSAFSILTTDLPPATQHTTIRQVGSLADKTSACLGPDSAPGWPLASGVRPTLACLALAQFEEGCEQALGHTCLPCAPRCRLCTKHLLQACFPRCPLQAERQQPGCLESGASTQQGVPLLTQAPHPHKPPFLAVPMPMCPPMPTQPLPLAPRPGV